jgi:hypothetical protein
MQLLLFPFHLHLQRGDSWRSRTKISTLGLVVVVVAAALVVVVVVEIVAESSATA